MTIATSHVSIPVIKKEIKVFPLSLSCCSLELESLMGPRFDWERLGFEFTEDHRIADILLLAGPFNPVSKKVVMELKAEMASQVKVVVLGVCACSGGMFQVTGGSGVAGLGEDLKVHLFVPGCPPRPESILFGMCKLMTDEASQ